MNLKQVTLNGFKSFADKTVFDFSNNITAIVGPNGCGKSNVVDAVKWVLGEQSAKSLRSGNMADVIFSGSGTRKASGMAEVILYFDNVPSSENGHDDLKITRKLYKSGDSEYLINGKVSRLKDIREIFMDTGLGTRAYSIIEQGQVDQLVTANKIDRRGLFEEAAGISKFKAHKKEAIRKLERTEQNLLRLADIVNEVQKQLRSIKLQAGKARNFLQYSERLKELRVNFSLSEYHKFKQTIEKKQQQLSNVEQSFGELIASVSREDAQLSEMVNQIIETENAVNKNDNLLISINGRIEQKKERISFLNSRIKELAERKEKASQDIQRFLEQTNVLDKDIKSKQEQLDQSENIYKEKEDRIKYLSDEIHEINLRCNSIQADLDDEKSGIIDIVRRTAQLHNEIGSLNNQRDSLAGQKDRLNTRANAAQSELEEMLTEKVQHQSRLEKISEILEELSANLEEKRCRIDLLNSELGRRSDHISNLKEKRSALQSEYNVLKDMEQKKEGLNKTVKEILIKAQSDDSLSYVEGIVADTISADPTYAAAVEAALEGISDALVVNSTSKLLADSRLTKELENRVNIVTTDRIEPFVDTLNLSKYDFVIGRAVEFVEFESKFSRLAWKLLGKTIIVDSTEKALELAANLKDGYKFVTLDGTVISDRFVLRTGSMGKASGLISRKSRINNLQKELEDISVQLKDANEHFERDSQENQHLGKLCQELRTSIYEANTEKTEANGKLSSLEQNIARIKREQPLISGELELLEEQIASSFEKEYESKQKLDELEEVKQQRDEHIGSLESQLSEEKSRIEEFNSSLTEVKIELGTIVEQRRSFATQISSLQSQLQHARITLESARNDITTCDEQIEQAKRSTLGSESEISELYMEKDKAQQQSKILVADVVELKEQKQELEGQLRVKKSQQNETEEKIHQIKLDLNQAQIKLDDLCQRVQEDLSMDLSKCYEDYEHEDVDWEAVRQEIKDLRQKIDRLGNVNVDAINEQEALEERNEFLTSQVEDLNKSKDQLQQLINKINKESREKFRVTFEQIRENFQVLFRKLFGGGKADIVLDNPEDILESGIEIIAKPPGKELRSISLLSGGEKTMTAIALLFAVFKSKPSPFCVLDEVDAALDEANNERFNLIVNEFKELSQFIIVTHSKRTMSVADVLFGVTMQTQGVSKKISVKFGEEDSDIAVA